MPHGEHATEAEVHLRVSVCEEMVRGVMQKITKTYG